MGEWLGDEVVGWGLVGWGFARPGELVVEALAGSEGRLCLWLLWGLLLRELITPAIFLRRMYHAMRGRGFFGKWEGFVVWDAGGVISALVLRGFSDSPCL